MRREALARWLNLSVIAAVVAVLTLVLVSGPTRVAYARDRCGSVDGTTPAPAEDTTFTISDLFPTSGQPAMVSGSVEMTADVRRLHRPVQRYRLAIDCAIRSLVTLYVIPADFIDNLSRWGSSS